MVEGVAYELTSNDGETVERKEVHEIRSNHEESDTRMILYAAYGAKLEYKVIQIRSPDSDMFFLLLHFASSISSTLLFDTGVGNMKRLINVSKVSEDFGQEYCTALLTLHAYTGCDTTSAFKGIGKVKPMKVFDKNKGLTVCFSKLGMSWDVNKEMIQDLEAFTCTLYGYPRYKSIDALRHDMLKRKCNGNSKLDPSKAIDLASLPPCGKTLLQHIRRSNLQSGVWRRALENFLEVPDVTNHGWVVVDGILEPLWCEGDLLPDELVDLLEENNNSESEEEESANECDVDDDSDYDEI